MPGRAYEVLTQVWWLKSIRNKRDIGQTTECINEKKLPGFTQAPTILKMCVMKMKV